MEKGKVEREEGRKAHVPSQTLKLRGIMATGIAERGASEVGEKFRPAKLITGHNLQCAPTERSNTNTHRNTTVFQLQAKTNTITYRA